MYSKVNSKTRVMEKMEVLSNTFSLTYARIEEIFNLLASLDEKYFVPDEELLPEILIYKLKIKRGNEKRFINFLTFCCIHVN